ncbi:MAG: bacillithiol biosynthesis BshC, partial [Myxococcota bacterium]
AQARSRDRLVSGAVAVVTGQQAGLFGGPLFTLYKAATAIVDARALEAETGVPCVPVFWLQNEDHDHDEIASCRVLGSDGRVHEVVAPGDPAHARRSIGARALGPAVVPALDQLERILGAASEVAEVLAALRGAYTADQSPDAAFRAWIDQWLGPHGLLVLDPRHPDLQAAARPVHLRAIALGSGPAEAGAAAVVAGGFTPQVHVRPGSPLPFVHPDGADGPRYRLAPGPGGWTLVGADRPVDLDTAALSSSALSRPIVQDHLLPTAAMVCGPGELAYFAQLPPVYAAFGLPMPAIVPRARFRWIDETTSRLLTQLGVGPDQRPEPYAPGAVDPLALERALLDPFQATLAGFDPLDDPALAKAIDKTRGTVTEVVGRLVDRVRRTLAARDEVRVDRMARLEARLRPGGEPQERVHAWLGLAARVGAHALVDRVLAEVVPWDGALRDLRP